MFAMSSAPRNFSWIVENKIAGLAFPDSTESIRYLVNNGIGYLITACKEMQPPISEVSGLNSTYIGIEDYSTFTLQQVNQFIVICKKAASEKKGVAVHCRAGLGRTGTLLACYLIYFEKYTAETAIKKVRELRPGSIETQSQVQTIQDFYDFTT